MRGLKEEARQRGVSDKVIKRALKGVRPVPQVIEKDRNQPEFKLTFEDYMKRMVTDHRIKLGVDMMQKHEVLLRQVSEKYGVPEAIIVAIWGMESSYGNFMGTWDIVAALVTLAYDKQQPSRAKYFREELINSLFILQDGHASYDTLRGSWAGAMGQCQFMPSSFRNFAVDFDGDGKADIWTSPADVAASIANYLAKHGWKTGEPYFEEVVTPKAVKPDLLGLKVQKPAGEWRDTYGVLSQSEPATLPPDCLASLVTTDGSFGPSYLATQNVSVVLRYNKSLFYALAVGHIAKSIQTASRT
ncbi:lytic murein transglycosylase [Klebsormidium nitens]|uniref:Lytic murein transglycosylase n=1 Tax=Klebsormidium nitens TaxID=105231 RepID=A0A1Y1HTD1_KLENI|nr:lytic murein transglycosylase [Klebsormidium nitens]|eukprot:GAQ79786.1 lytic murein transglycosylase [Klebsormidium nitens]